ncbi:MAG TPA: NnrS family protein [Methylothermaceae bacterium]|nr:NnrS family protein [Methylothermaceae bacterium]
MPPPTGRTTTPWHCASSCWNDCRPKPGKHRMSRTETRMHAWRWFFPAAALHAALVIPLSLRTATSHGSEMLTGFGLVVVAGYLLGNLPRRPLAGVFFLWLGARLAWLFVVPGLQTILQGLFAAAVAVIVIPRFVGPGRKWRNLSLAPLPALLAAVSVPLQLPWLAHQRLLEVMILLYAWLMAFMGGRLIAPAAAGARYHQGERLEARVQPALESWLVGLLAAAVIAAAITPWSLASSLPIAATALLVAIRLYRWQLWRCRGRIDLWCLGWGYAWIAVGLMLLAAVPTLGLDFRTALHGLTIGAMGTLTFNVMLRTAMQRGKVRPQADWLIPTGTLLITAAALLRLAIPVSVAQVAMVAGLSALCWSTAWLLLLVRVLIRPLESVG